jgi:hypothetical protein
VLLQILSQIGKCSADRFAREINIVVVVFRTQKPTGAATRIDVNPTPEQTIAKAAVGGRIGGGQLSVMARRQTVRCEDHLKHRAVPLYAAGNAVIASRPADRLDDPLPLSSNAVENRWTRKMAEDR